MGGNVGRHNLKYIVTDNSAQARVHLANICKHLGLTKASGPTKQYAPLMRIDDSDSEDCGKYIIPIVQEGIYKCDDLYSENELVEYQEHWDKEANTNTDDQDDSDNDTGGD